MYKQQFKKRNYHFLSAGLTCLLERTGRFCGKGFTLAEILLVITVTGIIASLTVPVLINDVRETQLRAALLKTFSETAQVTQLLEAENGSDLWNMGDGGYDNEYSLSMRAAYSKHLVTLKTGTTEEIFKFNPYFKYTNYSGSPSTFFSYYKDYVALLTNRGVFMSFLSKSNNVDSGYTKRGNIFIDINGAKPPNQWGKDLHSIVIAQTPRGNFVTLPDGSSYVQSVNANGIPGTWPDCIRNDPSSFANLGCTYYAMIDQLP